MIFAIKKWKINLSLFLPESEENKRSRRIRKKPFILSSLTLCQSVRHTLWLINALKSCECIPSPGRYFQCQLGRCYESSGGPFSIVITIVITHVITREIKIRNYVCNGKNANWISNWIHNNLFAYEIWYAIAYENEPSRLSYLKAWW